jgi:NADH:ubiquinone oxidoreductase subunit H
MKVISLMVPLLVAIAYLTLAERKLIGFIQARKGPNVIGLYGLLQPLVDGLKLFIKEMIIPNNCNRTIYYLCPIFSLTMSLIG